MKLSDIFGGFLKAAKEQGLEIEAEAPLATPVTQAQPLSLSREQRATIEAAVAPLQAADSPATDAMAARIAELEQRLAAQRTGEIARDAAAFAQQAVRDRRALPAEHDSLVRLYLMAAQDDQAMPWSAPADGAAPSRVALLQADVAARPQHTLISEQVRVGAGGVLEDGAQTRMSEGRRQALLATTPLGQVALKTIKTA